jgi:hypothetical protein
MVSLGRSLLVGLGLALASGASAQQTIDLTALVGSSGTNATTVAGSGNVVNLTGVIANSGGTALTRSGAAGATFDFNTGFADGADRVIGSTAGSGAFYVNLKTDSANTSPLILDTNRDGSFASESAVTGLGTHADSFITFDLAVIRAQNSLTADAPLTFTGLAGIANTTITPTSAAILLDGTSLAVYDWSSTGVIANNFALSLPGTGRYLTLAALSGTDGDNFYAHVGFANLQLQAVPEPSAVALLTLGIGAVWWLRRRRHVAN